MLELLANKTTKERSEIKAKEIAKVSFRGKYQIGDVKVEILNIFSQLEQKNGEVFLGVMARAWEKGAQLGFGADGSVDIERFRFFNPPILVDDPAGDIIREHSHRGQTFRRVLKEDPEEAIKQALLHTISVVKKDGGKIIPNKVGHTVSTFYPAAGENSPMDGHTDHSNATYSTVHDASVGTNASATGTVLYNYGYLYLGNYTLGRNAFLFDTSSIPDTDTISAATLSLYGHADKDDGDTQTVKIVTCTPASNSTISTDDYDQFGTTLQSDTAIRLNVWAVAYNDFPLNATGIASISKTGITKFASRLNLDIENTAPTGNGYCAAYSADDTAGDPKLVVTHAAAAAKPPSNLLLMGAG